MNIFMFDYIGMMQKSKYQQLTLNDLYSWWLIVMECKDLSFYHVSHNVDFESQTILFFDDTYLQKKMLGTLQDLSIPSSETLTLCLMSQVNEKNLINFIV
jgi:hypothetical protein